MTKARYLYELIDRCMMIACQDIILVENFELSDDREFYEKMEAQFRECMKFYDDMKMLVDRNEIDELMMDQELKTVLLLIRQKALDELLNDFRIFLNRTNISDKEEQMSLLKIELQSEVINAEYLWNKLTALRRLEQDNLSHVAS